MTTRLRGAKFVNESAAQDSLLSLATAPAESLLALDFVGTARGAPQEAVDLDQFDAQSTICEVELADGERVWLRRDELEHSPYFVSVVRRDGDVELAPVSSRERGLGSWAVKALRLFKVDPVQTFGGLAREKLVQHLERDICPGLFQVAGQPTELITPDLRSLSGEQPILLMLHGTFSSTVGSFGKLHSANGGLPWRRMTEAYGRRIVTLEHRTLSVNPMRNAIDAAQGLPDRARLHLLSHSRGGLIGEMLARTDAGVAGISRSDLDLLKEIDPTLYELAAELDEVLRGKALVVERFVRVACPARGTTLASERLRDWLTVAANLLARMLKLAASAALDTIGAAALTADAARTVDLLKAVILEAVKIEHIPGLQAMNPSSNFIRGLVNSESAVGGDRLAVVAGDAEGSGLFGRLKMFAVDRFFERDNDLVVDTASMIGGARRTQVYRHFATGPEISHFSYFGDPVVSEVIVHGLIEQHLTTAQGYAPERINQRPLRAPLRTPASRSDRADLPIVYLLPGIMGSHLTVDNELVWIDKWQLIRGGFASLDIAQADVVASALDGDTYQSLADALAADHEVIPFPYDWRLPIADSAARLNAVVRAKLADPSTGNRPIRFIAHSMGGLVVRAMMLLEESVWPKVRENPQARIVMLGTPNGGSHAITLLMTGQEKLVRLLATVDVRNSIEDIVAIAAKYGGALDMVPETGERDYYTVAGWQELALAKRQPDKWPTPSAADLARSKAFRTALAAQDLTGQPICYVAGHSKYTPVEARLIRVGNRHRVRFMANGEGDGRVPWSSGIPKGIPAWFVTAKHGSIPGHKDSHAGFRQLLNQGDTNLLSRSPPRVRGVAGMQDEYPIEPVNYLPTADELMRAAVDAQPAEPEQVDRSLPALQVRVIWGNLRYSEKPIVVGHYIGDQIVSAEKAVDRFVEGSLSRRLALGRYPGRIGTALAIPNPSGRLPGAVIIGLGQVSLRLSRADLVQAVQAGVSEWCARVLEARQSSEQESTAPPVRGLAFVAIGSGGGGMSLADVGGAIIDGVQRSLELLREHCGVGEFKRLNLRQVDFLELFEDRAHTLWHGLSSQLLRNAGSVRSAMAQYSFAEGEDRVIEGKGGLRRLVLDEPDEWWLPLKITQDNSRLVYESVGERARAELRGVGTHRRQIEELMRIAVAPGRPASAIAKTLFEMLIPNDLKDSLPSSDRLRLLVDSSSACYPWELILAGRSTAQSNPDQDIGLRSAGVSLIRQFTTAQFRASPRSGQLRNALVVGDPHTNDRFVRLPGALREAEAAKRRLDGMGFSTSREVLRGHLEILIELHARPYQIAHFAAHGVVDLRAWLDEQITSLKSKPARTDEDERREAQLRQSLEELGNDAISAMVIGDDVFLTHQNIEQMAYVPELVFINCCHLGSINPDKPHSVHTGNQPAAARAAGFAEKFIEIGVRAVVAAGWPVDDAAAEAFADHFYDALGAGKSFGDAASEARQLTKDEFPLTNTWAAYQCYGDPSYRLVADGRGYAGSRPTGQHHYGSARHLAWEGVTRIGDATQLADLARYAQDQSFDSDGELGNEIAEAYRSFNDFPQARHWYQKAAASEAGRMPLRGLEQLANLIARMEPVRASLGGKPTKVWLDRIDAVISMLEKLNQIGETQERLNLIGSAYKRKAIALIGAARDKALQSSAAAYVRASELAQDTDNAYPFVNAAVMQAAAEWTAAKPKLPSTLLRSLIRAIETRTSTKPAKDFWDFVGVADVLVLKAFACYRRPTDALAKEINENYDSASKRENNRGNWASVADQVRFMVDTLNSADKNRVPAALVNLLNRVLENVESRM